MRLRFRISWNARRCSLLALCGVLLVAGCAQNGDEPAPEASAPEGDADQAVLEAHLALLQAYEEQSIDQFVWLLSRSPQLVIFHPRSQSRFDGVDQARAGLLRMFERLQSASWTEAHPTLTVRGDVAWITAHVLIQSPALSTPLMARSTEVWVKESGEWKLIHAHWSETPGVFESDTSI
jgi:ketosteroid isomerase-like protein